MDCILRQYLTFVGHGYHHGTSQLWAPFHFEVTRNKVRIDYGYCLLEVREPGSPKDTTISRLPKVARRQR